MIILHTNKGDIKIELDFDKAPVTAKNFEQYVKDGFYDGVIFHRVIKGFMIQGGGMDENMNEVFSSNGGFVEIEFDFDVAFVGVQDNHGFPFVRIRF